MRAAVQSAIGRMDLREVEAPVAGPGELVVRVRAALTCGTDRKILDRGHEKFSPPLVMGHEFSGDVVEAGPGAPFSPGVAVMGGISGPCGRCGECLGGASNRCSSSEREIAWGAFAELVRVPARVAAQCVFRKPEALSYEAAAILDPVACVARGMDRLGSDLDGLLVVGAGAIGLIWIAAARSAGAADVSVVGKGAERLEAARRLGARVYELDSEEPPPSRIVVECVGTPAAWRRAYSWAAPGGRVMFFGGCAPGSEVSLPAERFHYREITATGSYHYRPEDARRAYEWLRDGAVDPSMLFSAEGDLSNLPSFFDRMRRGEGIKFVVRP